MSLVARVKNVLSADTIVLVPSKTAQVPAPERLLSLANVRGDDLLAAKEFVRRLLIGKDVRFTVVYKIPSGREFGDVLGPGFESLQKVLLESGWARLRDNFDEEQESDLYASFPLTEANARQNGFGVWNPLITAEKEVPLTSDLVFQLQKNPFPAVVEKVISGDRLLVRIDVGNNSFVHTPILLAGVRTPRNDDPTLPAHVIRAAHLAKASVENKLLTTLSELKISILGESQAGVPVASIIHPSGKNIGEALLDLGLAEVVDWQSTMVGSVTMGQLRKVEQTARALARGIFANTVAKAPAPASAGPKASSATSVKVGALIPNASVAKVVSADTITFRLANDLEITVQLASLRAPKPADRTLTTDAAQQQSLVATAREFVRQHAIGKSGTLYIDGLKEANAERGFDLRFQVSFKINNTTDLSELIVSNGFATVLKHGKATAHERSLNWDRLVEIEEQQKALGTRGVFYSKPDISKVLKVGTRIVDASESLAKAKTFLVGLQKRGRVSQGFHVEHVVLMSRLKLYSPKEDLKLTLILGGMANDRNEALLEQGFKYMTKRFYQRSVEFEVYDTDKLGGFIGNVFVAGQGTSATPVQVLLLEQGMAKVHHSAAANLFASAFEAAEQVAKLEKNGVWASYDTAAEAASIQASQLAYETKKLALLEPQYFDAEVVDVATDGILLFHKLDAATVKSFAQFKQDFNAFHAKNVSASSQLADSPQALGRAPKRGELVSAKFAENSKYYRAKVVGFDKPSNKYSVKHVDFGNIDAVPLSSLRQLPAQWQLSKVPAFAHTTTLQSLQLPPQKPTDYLTDAIYALEDLVFDKKLVMGSLPLQDGAAEYSSVVYDSEKSVRDPDYTINEDMVTQGWALVKASTNDKANSKLEQYLKSINNAQQKARSMHTGCWEFGDVTVDEEEYY